MASKRREQEVSSTMAQEQNVMERINEAITEASENARNAFEEATENARKAVEEATANARKAVNDVLDRVTGKESAVELNLDDVGVDLGEDRKVTATGTIRFSVKTLS
jgi:ElaB/YqjD/DUF883 family membrane-anchored ribosome-binding protein